MSITIVIKILFFNQIETIGAQGCLKNILSIVIDMLFSKQIKTLECSLRVSEFFSRLLSMLFQNNSFFQPNWHYGINESFCLIRFNMIFKPNLELGSPSVSHSFYFTNAQNFRIEISYNFYRTWVRSLATLVTNSLTPSLPNSHLVNLSLIVQDGATWCNMVQHGATWCNMVHHGER